MPNMVATRIAVKSIIVASLLLGIGMAVAGPYDMPGEIHDLQEEYPHKIMSFSTIVALMTGMWHTGSRGVLMTA